MLKRVYVSFVFVFIFLVLGVSLIVAQDTGANEGIIDNDATDIDTQTCNAFFSGYVYYSDANACKLEETSGCDNPYDYSTREECESANGINSEDKDDFNGRDKDKVFRDLEGCGNNCKKVCNDEECRSRCIGKCKSEYGFDKKGNGDCEQTCFDKASVIMPSCSGDMKAFGSYPDCDCEWVCDDFDELEEEYGDEEIVSAGITPDSPFYFLDNLFSGGDSIGNKEEKIAEIKAMIEKGNYGAARSALEKYMKHAEEFEKNSDPEKREEARRSAFAIRKALKEIKDMIPEDEREDFYDNIIEKEGELLTSVEISSKIKELCSLLAESSPIEYSRVCKTDDDSADWQKKLNKKLTGEQKEIAKKFVGVMKECFKTSGQTCRCEEIPFTDFADACSQAAPLAVACDIEGDERACEKLDDLDMPELPPYLQEIFDEMEMKESQYEMHMPRECVEAGVTNPKECGRVMIETNAPKECKQALLDSNCDSERECRGICDRIMMELHAPECIEQGITNPEDCKSFGGDRRDEHFDDRGPGMDCNSIQEPMERLECYDNKGSMAKSERGGFGDDYKGNCMNDDDWRRKKEECRNKFGQHAGDEPIYGDSGDGYECVIDARCIDFSQGKMDFEDIKQRERECADRCHSQGGAWDFSYGECKCRFDYEGGSEGGDYDGSESGCDDCASKCPGSSGTNCVNNRCECYYDNSVDSDGGDEGWVVDNDEGDSIDSGSSDVVVEDGGDDSDSSSDDSGSSDVVVDNVVESGGDDSDSSSDDGSSDDSSSSDGGGDAGITGEVVFWDYDLS
ncbi:hypothetical protein HOD75_01045 [archaeon]|nr:hypothetical protein [archaeon]MBT4241464.1 hypothetical protein [archaeon]MBT4417665.1 hypothetical protein [archaeon]